jgi:hypothetical protein
MKPLHRNPSAARTEERSAEVLFGATPISRIGVLLPVVPLYGDGALLIRELARRRGGWTRIALLGAAYAIVEEGLVLQLRDALHDGRQPN